MVHKHFKASTFFAISKQLCRIMSASSMCTLHFVMLNLLPINNIFQSINLKFVHLPLQRRRFICCTLICFVVRCRSTRDVTFISRTPACCYIYCCQLFLFVAFKVDRPQTTVVAKNLSVLQLFISRMPKMCAILQLDIPVTSQSKIYFSS